MSIFILASASPRRTELLGQAGIKHIVIPSQCPEHTEQSAPAGVVEDLSRQKAGDVSSRYREGHPDKDFMVLGSDTVVACDGNILGKPEDEDHAGQMLTRLQGRTHQVYTGVTCIKYKNGMRQIITFHECSDVSVYPMTGDEIAAYIRTGEPMDKAGGYGIQGCFARYIKGIRGDYSNIVGLPIGRLYQELKQLNKEG